MFSTPATARVQLSTVVLLAALVSAIAYQAGAVRAALAAPPTSVGVIDLVRVLEQMNERAQWDASIKSMEEGLETERMRRQTEAQSKFKQLENMGPGPERDALSEALAKELLDAEVWINFKRGQLDRERSLRWQSLYRHVRSEAEKLAEAEGYDLLLVNDATKDLPTEMAPNASAEGQTLQQISARRVIYAKKTIDLTDKLITRLNNAFAVRP